MNDNLIEILVIAGVVLAALLAIGIVFARLYQRSTKETAFVRTGLGGQKAITDGGAIVLPVFHERVLVNMNMLRLEVVRRERESLITKDRMRVDVTTAFFVRVKQTEEAVSIAAQTLGARTMSPDELEALVEAKFVDSLRATAATMTIQELQDKRRDFVQAVQNAVAEDLEKNGLELESVSLTSLDQTDKQFFNPNNAFDAEGLTRLTEQTEARRKQRNDVEQDTEVLVRTKNLKAQRMRLTIEKDQEFASLSQKREIENTRAEQSALIATQQAERSREGEAAKIEAERQVSQKRIEADREIKSAEIEKKLVLQTRQVKSGRAKRDRGQGIGCGRESRRTGPRRSGHDRSQGTPGGSACRRRRQARDQRCTQYLVRRAGGLAGAHLAAAAVAMHSGAGGAADGEDRLDPDFSGRRAAGRSVCGQCRRQRIGRDLSGTGDEFGAAVPVGQADRRCFDEGCRPVH